MIALYTFFLASFIVLTIIGTAFRGHSMKLMWPWESALPKGSHGTLTAFDPCVRPALVPASGISVRRIVTLADERKNEEFTEEERKRRSFLRTVMWSSAGLVLAESALAGLALFWPRKVEGFGSTIRAGEIERFRGRQRHPVPRREVLPSRLPEGMIALYWKCPHLGCTVPWERPRTVRVPVPRFDLRGTGQNVAGPAPRPWTICRSKSGATRYGSTPARSSSDGTLRRARDQGLIGRHCGHLVPLRRLRHVSSIRSRSSCFWSF